MSKSERPIHVEAPIVIACSVRSVQTSWQRKLLFRAAAIVIGLLPFVIAELSFALLDAGRPGRYRDPFVGFAGSRPLFVLNEAGDRYEIARNRQQFFRPDWFLAQKPADEFRIFCLGGSTVQGRPYAIETSFTTWLELSLQAADPSRKWQVVNCGGVSYASYRLVPVLQEMLSYRPDLIVLYTGHNEFLEERTYGDVKRVPKVTAWLHDRLGKFRTYWVLRSGLRKIAGKEAERIAEPKAQLETEVSARLDFRGGLALYHRDEQWRQGVIAHYEFNVRRMITLCQTAGVPVLLVNPVCNLRDCPPFKSQHRDDMKPQELAQYDRLLDQAREYYHSDLRKSVRLLEEAAAMDDQFAGVFFDLGKCYEGVGRFHDARAAYTRAKELDVCPLRILEPMNEAVVAVARDTGTPLVDVKGSIEAASRLGIPGGDLLVDHVHPSVETHQKIAGLLADAMIGQGWLKPADSWAEDRDRAFARHTASLDDFYYLKGKQRLENLIGWTQGLVTAERPDKKKDRSEKRDEPSVPNPTNETSTETSP